MEKMISQRHFLLCFQAAVNITSSAFENKADSRVFLSTQVLQFLTFSINEGLFLFIFPYLLQKDLGELSVLSVQGYAEIHAKYFLLSM